MQASPKVLTIFRWLGLLEAALAVGIGLFGEGLLYLPPRARPLLTALLLGGAAFGVYSWVSTRKAFVPIVTGAIFAIAAANFALSTFWGARYAATLEPDPDAIYRLIPNVVKLSKNPNGDWIRWKVNSRGFRGPELKLDSSATRVVVYGDSFVQAEFSRHEDTFTAQLAKRLSGRLNGPVEAVNAGVNGYGPDQSLRRMQRDLRELRPRVTLLVVFPGNDFGDLVRNRLYRLGPDDQLEENRFAMSPRLIRSFEGSRHRPVILNAIEAAWRAWRAERLVVDDAELLAARRREFEDYIVKGNNEIDNIGTDSGDVDMATDPTSPSAKYKIQLMERILEQCARSALENGSALALVVVGRVEDLAGEAARDLAVFPNYRPSNLTDLVESIARRLDIPCLNTYDRFQQAGPNHVYFRADNNNHWNDAGQRLAAELAANFLTRGDGPILQPTRNSIGQPP